MGVHGSAVVTGGGGYLGVRLGCALKAAGYEVVLLDVQPPPAYPPLPRGVRFSTCDVRDVELLTKWFQDADAVFHVASYGMSGAAQLQRKLVEEINVGGTQAVIHACLAAGVERLVYTSTCNVVFGGQRIDGASEAELPYFPLHCHPDVYSRSKALAEQAVLAANGTPLPERALTRRDHRRGRHEDGEQQPCLCTCAVRASAIWGPGEQRHLPRVVDYTEKGLFRFTFGRADALADFVHVDNLVQMHILAAEGLGAGRGHVAAGQAYFASDGAPLNNFAFFEQLVVGLGYPRPALRLPLWLVYWAAFLLELLYATIGRVWDFSSLFLLTRAEVFKAGQHHWFSIHKSRSELGYAPKTHPFQPVLDWFLERGHGTPAARRQWEQRQRQRQRADGEALAAARRRMPRSHSDGLVASM